MGLGKSVDKTGENFEINPWMLGNLVHIVEQR